MNSSKESSVPVTPSQPSYLPPPLSYYAYVPPYMMPTMSSIPSSHSIVQKKIPSLREFLSELDEIYGEGTYTRFEPSFAEQVSSIYSLSQKKPENYSLSSNACNSCNLFSNCMLQNKT
jgi:hypothetical protein